MSFVPTDFKVPLELEHDEFRLRMLTIHDVVKDFEAVVTSTQHLLGLFAPSDTWPEGLTLEQNLIDLAWHQKEFQRRSSFAYTVVNPSETRVLGCVYLYPTSKQNYDAAVFLWARQSELSVVLEQKLYTTIQQWLEQAWPFERVAFPGRGISWEDWAMLPNKTD
jgi:hypothetical protein